MISVGRAKILSYEVGLLTKGSSKQAPIKPDEVTEKEIKLPEIALNPGDSLAVEMFIDGELDGDPAVTLQAAGFSIERPDSNFVADPDAARSLFATVLGASSASRHCSPRFSRG